MKRIFLSFIVLTLSIILAACGLEGSDTGPFEVKFDTLGGTLETTQVVELNALAEAPNDPVYADYTFSGWYTNKRFTSAWNFDENGVNNNITLYAKWTSEITHTVSKANGTDNLGATTYGRETVTESFRIQPNVVVTFALEVADILSVVGLNEAGITYFGLPKNNLPASISEFSGNNYPNTGTLFEPNYDTLDLMLPDLIIIGGRSSALYETLKERYLYADVLDVSNTTFSFAQQRQVFQNLGTIFPNIKAELDGYITQFETALTELQALSAGKNALFLLINGDDISLFGAGSRYGVIYDEVGFLPTDPDAEVFAAHGNIVSYEYVSAVNPQIIFLMDRSAAVGGSGAITQVMQNALVQATIAGQNNDIYILDPASWYILPGGIKSTIQMIEDLMQVFE